MDGKIFTIDANGALTALFEQEFAAETDFQELIARHVDLLGGEQMNVEAPRRFFLVKREFGVPSEEKGSGRWSLDHLFLDQDGIPTLVEIKRQSDSRLTGSRREVIGQLLDYAANGCKYWSVEAIRAAVESRSEEFERFIEEDSVDEFWEKVSENLRSERMRLVIVADLIPIELRRVIEFLNVNFQENIEVLGVEVRHYVAKDKQLKTLVPRVLGLTSKRRAFISSDNQWDENSFFEDLAKRGDSESAPVALEILNWIKKQKRNHHFTIWFGKGKTMGSFVPTYHLGGKKHHLFAVWSNNSIEFYFQHLKNHPPFDEQSKRIELISRLNKISSTFIPEEKNDKRPNLHLKCFAGENTKLLLRELDWLVEQIRLANP